MRRCNFSSPYTSSKALIDIVAGRERNYLQLVAKEFASLEKKARDLAKDVASETSFHYKEVALGLLQTDAEYRAQVIRDACKGAGTDDKESDSIILRSYASSSP